MLRMKPKLLFIIFLSFQVFACSNNYYVKRDNIHKEYQEQINYLGKKESARLLLIDKKQLNAEKIKISDNSLIFIESDSVQYSTLPLNQIKRISFRDHKVGFGYGIMVGAGLGILFGLITIDESSDMGGMKVIVYGGVGMLIGSIFGGVSGSDRNYIFESDGNVGAPLPSKTSFFEGGRPVFPDYEGYLKVILKSR